MDPYIDIRTLTNAKESKKQTHGPSLIRKHAESDTRTLTVDGIGAGATPAVGAPHRKERVGTTKAYRTLS